MRATAAVTIGNRTGELHVFVVWISGVQIEVFICPAALRVMSTAELVIAQAVGHFDGNTSITCKREEVLIQRLYIGYCCSTPGSTAAAINLGCRNGKLHVCVV